MRSPSGRLVANIDSELKKALYSTLAASGRTFKEWLIEAAQAEITAARGARGSESVSPIAESTPHRQLLEHPQESSDSHRRFSLVSMFSGCGGMDLGFLGGFKSLGIQYAPHPYDIVWANDMNLRACDTYQRNLGHRIIPGDVWEAMDTLPSEADLIIGGFPCQDISINGKRAGINGARSGLYRAMVEAVSRVKPKVFVAENVKGLLTKQYQESLAKVISDFAELGYTVTYDLYQAADYGVPQTRERVFIVGVRDSHVRFVPPKPTHSKDNWVSAEAAIADLASQAENPEINHIWSRAAKSPEQGNRRMIADRPGYTIRAECHGNIQFHYDLPRRISMREAARFQSFPDSFIFEAKLRETERMVGNAVPPVLAWHIARQVLSTLQAFEGSQGVGTTSAAALIGD